MEPKGHKQIVLRLRWVTIIITSYLILFGRGIVSPELLPSVIILFYLISKCVNRVPFYGAVILCMDSPAVRSIRNRAKRRVVTYSVEIPADFRVKDVQLYGFSSAFTLLYGGKEVGRFNLPVPGMYNVANALAAFATGNELGIGFEAMAQAMAVFSGVHRRLEKLGERNGIVVYDDYGHHPTEVRVTLEALRHAFPDRRIVVVFQPHRYTRTRALAEEFGTCFAAADELTLTKIYAASDSPKSPEWTPR